MEICVGGRTGGLALPRGYRNGGKFLESIPSRSKRSQVYRACLKARLVLFSNRFWLKGKTYFSILSSTTFYYSPPQPPNHHSLSFIELAKIRTSELFVTLLIYIFLFLSSLMKFSNVIRRLRRPFDRSTNLISSYYSILIIATRLIT